METPQSSLNRTEAPVSTERTPENQAALEQLLSLENINDIRDYQGRLYSDTRDRLQSEGTPWAEAASTADTFAQDFYDEQITKFAMRNNLQTTEFNSVQEILEPYSLVKMGNEEWDLGLTNDLNGDERAPSGHSRFAAEANTFLRPTVEEVKAEVEISEPEEATPETKPLDVIQLEEAEPAATAESAPERVYDNAQLVQRRAHLSRLAAKRSNRLFGEGGEKYQQAEAEYNEEVIRSIKEELQDMLDDPAVTEEAKRAHVTARIFEEQASLREATIEKIENTPVRKFIGWMNKGGVVKRTLKGVGFGLAAGAVAGVAGVVGAGAVGVGVAAGVMTAARFARGFAKAHHKNAGNAHSLEVTDPSAVHEELSKTSKNNTIDQHFNAAQAAFQSRFEKDTKAEQKRLGRSVTYGIGAAALGAVIGGAGTYALQESGAFEAVGNWFSDTANAANGPELTQAEADAAEAKEILDRASVPDELQAPGTGAEVIPDTNFVIDSGEGGISFFEGLGLTEAQWYEAQPELAAKFPGEFLSDGQINNAGQLSIEAQDYIKTRFSL